MLEAGLEATVEERVTEAMTAVALGSGDVPVLGTVGRLSPQLGYYGHDDWAAVSDWHR